MTGHKYGGRVFTPNTAYTAYIERMADDAVYAGLQNRRTPDNRVNWQVSSGKTTSFYRDYLARKDWWESKRLELKNLGIIKSNEEVDLTTVARIIHPTKFKPCYHCGEQINIGYYYFSKALANRINSILGRPLFEKGQAIDILFLLDLSAEEEAIIFKEIRRILPEREEFFQKLGFSREAFLASIHLKNDSGWLSPGYWGQVPYRLDGLHDYCSANECRTMHDKGRNAVNMRSYNVDRRAFEQWSQGNWRLADALYNRAGPGICSICGISLEKVSPDHVGPVSCGFKQMPLFTPTCIPHNSAKGRRFTKSDVEVMIRYEAVTGQSVAGWHVEHLWERYKILCDNDIKATILSNYMRSYQDVYLRILCSLAINGGHTTLVKLLQYDLAFLDYDFPGLNTAKLTFDSITEIHHTKTQNRISRAARVVRIAFDSLQEYAAKGPEERNIVADVALSLEWAVEQALSAAENRKLLVPGNPWEFLTDFSLSPVIREKKIGELQEYFYTSLDESEKGLIDDLSKIFKQLSDKTNIFA